MYLFRLALASLANRRFTALLTISPSPSPPACCWRWSGPHRGQDQLRQYHLRNRPDRRRALRLGEPAALLGIPHRQRDQQHPLGQLPALRRKPAGEVGDPDLPRRLAPRLPGNGYRCRLFRALPLRPRPGTATGRGPRLRPGPVRRGARRRGGRSPAQARREDRAGPWGEHGEPGQARRQAVHRGRHPPAHRYPGGPHPAYPSPAWRRCTSTGATGAGDAVPRVSANRRGTWTCNHRRSPRSWSA